MLADATCGNSTTGSGECAMPLETELAHYEVLKAELLKHHEGKYALIIGQDLLGVYDHSEEAYAHGLEKCGNVPMLIKHITKDEKIDIIPALTLGLFHANI
jgi:hypothetical protein